MTTVGQWIKIPSFISSFNKEYILQSLLKKTKSELYLSWNTVLTKDQLKKCSIALSLCEKGVPLAYVFKETNFYSSTFQVNKNVFIPRIDTEVLIDVVLHQIKTPPQHFMDWGCGSGCIGLSLLRKWSTSHLISIDKSQEAISCTQNNASALNFHDNSFSSLHQDVFFLETKKFPPISLIVANPPYIAWEDPYLDSQVKMYEPHAALFSGGTGLECIEDWIEKAIEFLSLQGGDYIFEIGFDQFKKVKRIIQKYPLICYSKFYKDYQQHHRVVHCVVRKKY